MAYPGVWEEDRRGDRVKRRTIWCRFWGWFAGRCGLRKKERARALPLLWTQEKMQKLECDNRYQCNGKKIVAPVLISVESRADNNRIDAHLVLPIYDSKNWIGDFSEPAVEWEKSGKPGVFYTDPEKAGKYRALSLGKKGQVLSGFTEHTIQDIGINIKPQTGAFQFYPGSGMPKLWRDAAAVAVEAW